LIKVLKQLWRFGNLEKVPNPSEKAPRENNKDTRLDIPYLIAHFYSLYGLFKGIF